MSVIHVKAAPGTKMPKAGLPRTYINDADPVAVEDSHYYRRAIMDGDVIDVTAEVEAEKATSTESASAGTPKSGAKSAAKDSA